ncbi:MAG: aminotransferase class V-fold PLP-dependent enzyme [Planctomycetes bacterium]|nr:aminotransferase class V-fold PLP-dependent enzyme [Planctomycetota bacterium]
MNAIDLDNNATTRPAPEVVEAVQAALREHWHNPSSVHRPGQATRQQLELARERLAKLIGCRDRDLVLTSGGTEAANLAVLGTLAHLHDRPVLVTNRLEHVCVRETAEILARRGREVVWLPLDTRGLIDLDALDDLLRQRADEIALVSVMWANNETGHLQPVQEIGRRCREHGVRFHTDAVQCVGRVPVDASTLPIDLLSFSAHKCHGPKGVGGLYLRRGVRVEPQALGGPQEQQRRAGTENVPGVLGAGVAAQLALDWLAGDGPKRAETLRDRFERGVLDAVGGSVVNGAAAGRVWSTTSIGFPRLEAEAILILLSERGVCASAGAACSSGSLDPSPVLLAMGIDPVVAHGSVRFSVSRETTDTEIDRALEIVPEVIDRLSRSLAGV